MDAEEDQEMIISLNGANDSGFSRSYPRQRFSSSSPVVVKPSTVAGNDDVVGLLAHVVLAGVHQSVDFGFALFFVVLQARTERAESAGGRRALFNGITRPDRSPFQTARSRPPYHLKHSRHSF